MTHNRCKITAFRADTWANIDIMCGKIDGFGIMGYGLRGTGDGFASLTVGRYSGQ